MCRLSFEIREWAFRRIFCRLFSIDFASRTALVPDDMTDSAWALRSFVTSLSFTAARYQQRVKVRTKALPSSFRCRFCSRNDLFRFRYQNTSQQTETNLMRAAWKASRFMLSMTMLI